MMPSLSRISLSAAAFRLQFSCSSRNSLLSQSFCAGGSMASKNLIAHNSATFFKFNVRLFSRSTVVSSMPTSEHEKVHRLTEYSGASAYLNKKINLVDVTKVLIIGSGALSIGQAGEFDYSGKL